VNTAVATARDDALVTTARCSIDSNVRRSRFASKNYGCNNHVNNFFRLIEPTKLIDQAGKNRLISYNLKADEILVHGTSLAASQ
jgi:hypothetical protein